MPLYKGSLKKNLCIPAFRMYTPTEEGGITFTYYSRARIEASGVLEENLAKYMQVVNYS